MTISHSNLKLIYFLCINLGLYDQYSDSMVGFEQDLSCKIKIPSVLVKEITGYAKAWDRGLILTYFTEPRPLSLNTLKLLKINGFIELGVSRIHRDVINDHPNINDVLQKLCFFGRLSRLKALMFRCTSKELSNLITQASYGGHLKIVKFLCTYAVDDFEFTSLCKYGQFLIDIAELNCPRKNKIILYLVEFFKIWPESQHVRNELSDILTNCILRSNTKLFFSLLNIWEMDIKDIEFTNTVKLRMCSHRCVTVEALETMWPFLGIDREFLITPGLSGVSYFARIVHNKYVVPKLKFIVEKAGITREDAQHIIDHSEKINFSTSPFEVLQYLVEKFDLNVEPKPLCGFPTNEKMTWLLDRWHRSTTASYK